MPHGVRYHYTHGTIQLQPHSQNHHLVKPGLDNKRAVFNAFFISSNDFSASSVQLMGCRFFLPDSKFKMKQRFQLTNSMRRRTSRRARIIQNGRNFLRISSKTLWVHYKNQNTLKMHDTIFSFYRGGYSDVIKKNKTVQFQGGALNYCL